MQESNWLLFGPKPFKRLNSSNVSLVEYIKPVPMEKNEFRCGDLTVLRAFWFSQPNRLSSQRTKSSSPTKIEYSGVRSIGKKTSNWFWTSFSWFIKKLSKLIRVLWIFRTYLKYNTKQKQRPIIPWPRNDYKTVHWDLEEWLYQANYWGKRELISSDETGATA